VLELACGPGVRTSALLRHAADVTAVDASAEMLAIVAARTAGSRVRVIRADLSAWRPGRRYDAVFTGFWMRGAHRRHRFKHHPPVRPDGTAYRLVEVPHTPDGRQSQLRQLGWHIAVHPTAGPFYWGAGQRATNT
jgi:SAM-dependent methyltransferase